MKFRSLLLFVLATTCTVSAGAQIAIYGKLDATHFNNNANKTSAWFYGPGLGVYYDFAHAGPIAVGADLRGDYLFSSNDRYRSILVGARVAVKPPLLPIRPYVEGLIGAAGTKSTQDGTFNTSSSVSFSNTFGTKFAYQILGGVDVTVLPHVDVRLAELGYGHVSAVSSASNSPASSVFSFSTGLVLRLF
jgi:hypothetical protein